MMMSCVKETGKIRILSHLPVWDILKSPKNEAENGTFLQFNFGESRAVNSLKFCALYCLQLTENEYVWKEKTEATVVL